MEWENAQSLSVEEKQIAYEEARIANPDASAKDMALAYRIALLKVGVKKGGTNLGEVDLSLFSETDGEENGEDDSDASEDKTKALRKDVQRRNQVSPPSSPEQNEYLNHLMKLPEMRQAEARIRTLFPSTPLPTR